MAIESVELILPEIPPLKSAYRGKNGFFDPLGPIKKKLGMVVASQTKNHECPFKGPIYAQVEFIMSPPTSYSKKKQRELIAKKRHVSKPDIDNLTKTLFDILKGIVFVDDNQIFEYSAIKYWGDESQTLVTIWHYLTDSKPLGK